MLGGRQDTTGRRRARGYDPHFHKKTGAAAVAGRRSGASEEKEGERGLVHTQHGMLLLHHVFGGSLRTHKVHIT